MPERDSKGRFVKGKSANPKGRPKGSRNRADLTKAFIKDVALVWEERGLEGLWEASKQNPMAFAKLVAQVIPRDDNLLVTHDGNVDVREVKIGFLDVQDKDEEDQALTH